MDLNSIASKLAFKKRSIIASGVIDKISIFDFDGTLFKSPVQPPWWPLTSFWDRLETLSPPLVPENPDLSWWSQEMLREAKKSIDDPRSYTCLLTGRLEKFRDRIEYLLDSVGLSFNDRYFGSDGSTLLNKLQVIEDLVALFPEAKIVEMWDDVEEYSDEFRTKIEDLGLAPMVHLIPSKTREFDSGLSTSLASWGQPLSERGDYGSHSNPSLPRGDDNTKVSKIVKTRNEEEYCVKSDKKDSNWSGGCYPSREKAEARLKQVEMFKHLKSH